MNFTRVFKNKAGTHCVSVQMSFTDCAKARRVAAALDRIKADAACERSTFSQKLAKIILAARGQA